MNQNTPEKKSLVRKHHGIHLQQCPARGLGILESMFSYPDCVFNCAEAILTEPRLEATQPLLQGPLFAEGAYKVLGSHTSYYIRFT